MVRAWVQRLVARWWPPEEPPEPQTRYGADLIDRLDVLVTAYCPCGSTYLHHLTLVSTSECRRCGRTLAIRSLQYLRPRFSDLPDPNVSVGYVVTPENLRARTTQGVH